MDAGKLIASSATRRMRLRDNGSSYDRVGVRHFPRNSLLNSRNTRAGKHQHQRQRANGKQLTTFANLNARKTPNHAAAALDHRFGKQCTFTREVHDAICGRLGHRPRQIPGDSLQALFNDMKLYVSNAQVDKMIQCARQSKHIGRKNGGSQYLTFGELCFITRTLQMQKPKHKDIVHQKPPQLQLQPHNENKCLEKFEVFLGGSCNPTTWRTDTAIPELQKHGITYYNPQVSAWAPELVALEHNAKQSACLLLYVVDSQTRSVVGMLEVAYLVASGRCVVLVAYPYREGQAIMDEPITQSEYLDLVNGQTSLLALVKSQGIKVHNSLATALQCTANILRNGTTNGMTADEQVTHKLKKLREVFDSFDANQTGEISLTSVVDAYQRLTNKTIDLRSLCDYLSTKRADAAHLRISFDQFCVLVAEFGVDDVGVEPFATSGDDWLSRQLPFNNQSESNNLKSANNETMSFDLFLGGSRSGKDWRAQFEPLLKEKNITYCSSNGSSDACVTENTLVQLKRPLDNSRVLLFYITNDTRSLSSMILAAHYLGLERDVVLCIEHLAAEGVQIAGENLTTQAIKDYNRGRVYLADMAKRKQIPVFESITEAVHAAIDKCRD
ncbi:uncharacterized protein raw isoform X3 [Atheta coriaria]|uniref:uncharacterized protein raw isoform X3 n=1 Tax=Dalotia coriaria TaxID=877792 RepID=UPI0031F47904